jgi:hypothetical protein
MGWKSFIMDCQEEASKAEAKAKSERLEKEEGTIPEIGELIERLVDRVDKLELEIEEVKSQLEDE